MADKNVSLDGSTSRHAVNEDQSTSDNGHPLLQPADTKTDLSKSKDSGKLRYGMPLFTANAACVLWLWMIGVVYSGGVVRTLERRFGLRSTQTNIILTSGDIVHMCIVVFVGYFGRRGHKPRIMCVTALFSGVGNFLMAVPHWLYNSSASTMSAFNNQCTSCTSLTGHMDLLIISSFRIPIS